MAYKVADDKCVFETNGRSEETGTGYPVTSKYGRTPPNKHGGVGSQQQQTT